MERPDDARLIKRYANRKLYDTRASRYVTLQQIAEFVREGEEVVIIDNKSKEDLTHVTLAQIIYEEEKNVEHREERRSIPRLREFIQTRREALIGSLPTLDSLPAPISKLVHKKEDEEEPAEPKGAESKGFVKGSLEDAQKMLEDLKSVADDRVRSVLGWALSNVSQLEGEVARLRQRIEELEATIPRRDDESE